MAVNLHVYWKGNTDGTCEKITSLEEIGKFNEVASEIYQTLIQPVLPYMSGKRLVIVPHDVLHYLPFQALISPKGRYLIEDYAIHYLSSASLMKFTTAKRRAKRGERVLALGNPELAGSKLGLQFAELETRLNISEDLVPISEFRMRTAEFVAKVMKTKRPIILIQRGRSAAVLEDVREFERRVERLELLEAILAGLRAAEKGLVVSHKKAMTELDRVLSA